MKTYRNVSGHPEDLEGGPIVPSGATHEFTEEQLDSEYNKAKIEEGKFAFIASPSKDDPLNRDALLKRAKELEVQNPDKLDDKKLRAAVSDAEKKGDES